MTATYDAEFFKTTVFLPKTEFPMRGDLPQREPEALERWRRYVAGRKATTNNEFD